MTVDFKKHQRIGIFVDIQNLFYSAKFQYQARVNFDHLLTRLVDGRLLIRAIAYAVQTPEIDQTNFHDMLTRLGFEIKVKDLKVRADGSTKGDWDMGMAIDAISMAERLDVITLVTGDGDFCDLVNMLKSRGVRIEICSFPKSTAMELIQSSDMYIPIEPAMLIKERNVRVKREE